MSPMERPTWLNAKEALLAALMVVVLLVVAVVKADVRDMSARSSILMEAIFVDLGPGGEIDR